MGSEEADEGDAVHPPAVKRFAAAKPPKTNLKQRQSLPAAGQLASSEDILSQSDNDWDFASEEDSDDEWSMTSADRTRVSRARSCPRPARGSRPPARSPGPTAPAGPGAPTSVDKSSEDTRPVASAARRKVAVRSVAVRVGAGEQLPANAVITAVAAPERAKESKKNIQAGGSDSSAVSVLPAEENGLTKGEVHHRGKGRSESRPGDAQEGERTVAVRPVEGPTRHSSKAADGTTTKRKREDHDRTASSKHIQQASTRTMNFDETAVPTRPSSCSNAIPGAAMAAKVHGANLPQNQSQRCKAPAVSETDHHSNELKAAASTSQARLDQADDSDKANQKATTSGTNCVAKEVGGVAAPVQRAALLTVAEQPNALRSSQRKEIMETQADSSQLVKTAGIDRQPSSKRHSGAVNLECSARGQGSSLHKLKRAYEGIVCEQGEVSGCRGENHAEPEPAPAGSTSSELKGIIPGISEAPLQEVGGASCVSETEPPTCRSEPDSEVPRSPQRTTPVQITVEHGSTKPEPFSNPGQACTDIHVNGLANGTMAVARSAPTSSGSGQQLLKTHVQSLQAGVRTRGGSTVPEPISQDPVPMNEVADRKSSRESISTKTDQQDSNLESAATADQLIGGPGSQDLTRSVQLGGNKLTVKQLGSSVSNHPAPSGLGCIVTPAAAQGDAGRYNAPVLEPGEVFEQTQPKVDSELEPGLLTAIPRQLMGSYTTGTSDTKDKISEPVTVSTVASDERGCSKNTDSPSGNSPAATGACSSNVESKFSSGAAHTSKCATARMEAEKPLMTVKSAGSCGLEAPEPVENLRCASRSIHCEEYAFATMYCADWKQGRLKNGARTYCNNVIRGFVLEATFLALQLRYLRLDSPYVFQRGDITKLQDPEYAGRPTYDEGLQVSDDHLALFSGGGFGGFMGGKLARCLAAATGDPARRPVPVAKAAEEGYNRSWQILLEARTASTVRVAHEARALAGAGRQKEAGQLWRLWTEPRGGSADGPRGLPTVSGLVVSLCTSAGGATRLHFVGAGDCRLALLRRTTPGGLFACQTLSPSAPGQRFGLERGARQCQPVVMQAPLEVGDVVVVGNAVFWSRLAREEGRVVQQLLTIVNQGGQPEALAVEIGRRLRAFVERAAGHAGDVTLFVSVIARGACSAVSTQAHGDTAQSVSQPGPATAAGVLGPQKDPGA